ncbi:ADP-glyceromanno-heptose 6-epimerase [Roseomonas sp. SSH11]|uniref:ADP-L-glycero-D-manno-heptose-6-epimerase n=1 Tax=Pararoseomonas baculiformis TaxID=2820812 RepID=A0ABS4A8R4_9PROT|nr:ADP-glyceromanno-heptose 6-epimerase [Pararoseomonas baculiformis]MBP0443382.1 ADP-glyceromanno-heptose 6-epimerase [Pararoseomonas baculiformis]
MFLITGGAGFIGSNLVAALSARGAEVMVSDRLRDGPKWRNIRDAVIAGIVAPEDLPRWLDGAPKLEAVFHLGAVSATTVTDGDLVAGSNLNLTLRLWDWCARHRVPLIYASSAATYGDGAEGFDDDMDPRALSRLKPLNLYGWSKHATDRRIVQMLGRGQPAPPQWAGLKFFNVYGPNEAHKGRMASVVLHKWRQVAAGEPATLFASDRPEFPDGGQLRDFVHVDDCVAAMLWLAENPGVSGLFNIGTGTARSFADLARAIYAARQQPPDIRYVPMPEDLRGKYQYFTEARMDRLRDAGFDRPPTSLEEGVARYVRQLDSAEVPA